MACVALLCTPAVGIAADPSGSSAEAADHAAAPLARGAGYAQPRGERRVRALQRRLRTLGQHPGPVDGLFGPLTEAAVRGLQRDSGVSVDGIVGPQTRRVLNTGAPSLAPGAGYGEAGERGQVRRVQRRLRALGHRPGPIDGLYGPRTRAAVERFQRAAGHPATGVVSHETAVALARADSAQPVRSAGDARRESEPRPQAPQPAGSGSDQSRTQAPKAAGDQTEGSDAANSTSTVLLILLAIVLAAGCVAGAGWLGRRRQRPEAAAVAVTPSPEPDQPQSGVAAIGYVSVREPEAADRNELDHQMAAINTGCRERGLRLTEVIRDLEQANDTASDRPGMREALRHLSDGEESCLVVSELGRLSRSAPEIGEIVESLRRSEARLVAVGDGLDTGTWSSHEAADVPVSHPEANGEPPRSEQTSRPQPQSRQEPTRGRNGGGRPAQYDVPALKKRIRVMRERGMTLQAIADQLNSENVPTLRGGAEWRPSAVQAATGYQRPGSKAGRPTSRTGYAGGKGRELSEAFLRAWGRRPPMRRETWLPATPASAQAARSIVREAAAEVGLDGDRLWDLMLASTEAVTNAVQHGKPWPNECVLFTTEPCPRGLRVEVCDLGTFDSALEPAPLEATSGRGMQIIAALVDRLEVKNGGGPTRVRFEKHRPLPAPACDHQPEEVLTVQ